MAALYRLNLLLKNKNIQFVYTAISSIIYIYMYNVFIHVFGIFQFPLLQFPQDIAPVWMERSLRIWQRSWQAKSVAICSLAGESLPLKAGV